MLSSLRKLNELTTDEIDELKPYDSTSYSMRRIGLPYVVWVYTYKTESSPIVKITKPSSKISWQNFRKKKALELRCCKSEYIIKLEQKAKDKVEK